VKLSLLFFATLTTAASLAACSAAEMGGTRSDRSGNDPSEDEDPTGRSAPTYRETDYEDDAGPKKPKPSTRDGGASDAAPPSPACRTAFTRKEVAALFASRCAPCHTSGASGGMSLAGDFRTGTVGKASTQVPSMKRIEEGDREKSYLFHKLRGTHADVGGTGSRMPRNGPPYLSDEEIEGVGAFIDAL
jgi:mono/diheme cytochrome c family protein